MTQTIFSLVLTSMATAGMAVLWRNWLEDHKNWKEFIKAKLSAFGKSILCGSCLTYWLSLLFTLTVKPLSAWLPFGDSIYGNLFMQWMALSWLSVSLRFAYVALQELVHYQMHHLKHDHGHDVHVK